MLSFAARHQEEIQNDEIHNRFGVGNRRCRLFVVRGGNGAGFF
jgi:hypothetical protein